MVSDKDKKRLSKYILKEGDIVFSRVGSIDRCTYVSKKEEGWLFSGRCIRVRINEKADARYISFYFRQKYFKEMMLNISVGATMPSLNTSLMDNLPIFLPSKENQQKIAAVLSAFDSKIEINDRINTELEAMAKTLYDYWFVQFDFPNEDGKPYKTSGGKMVWNAELKRDIPEGWEVETFGKYANLKGGFAFKSDWWTDSGLPVIKIKDINEKFTLSIENCSCVSVDKYEKAKKYEAFSGDVVIAMTGATIGKFGIVPKINKPILVNQRVGLFNLGKHPNL
ncbi:MAG: restriction endonuclease subunit S [Bacteroidetes bacterium]|nr:restriction endonuclease subunit S [Bacteroidota bacterium]